MEKQKRNLILKDIKLRTEQNDEGKKYLTGIIPYNSEGETASGWYREVITKTAFTQSLKSGRAIFAFKNHNSDYPLGNTKTGTLSLKSTDKGLECRCELPDTTYANDLIISIKRGDCSGMSFGFLPIKEDEVNGVTHLREVKLFEVSYGVPIPFYPEAKAETDIRSLTGNIFQFLKKRGAQMDKETIKLLKRFKDDLQKIIETAEKSTSAEEGTNSGSTDAAEKEKQDAETLKEAEEEKKKRANLLLKLNLIEI